MTIELMYYNQSLKEELLNSTKKFNYHASVSTIRKDVSFVILDKYYYEYLGLSNDNNPIIEINPSDFTTILNNRYKLGINAIKFIEKIKNRIVSEIDPYGEEDWEE